MSAPRDEYTVVYVAAPSTDVDKTVDALRKNDRIVVETVRSVAEGCKRLDTGDVDCIVSEYRLPDEGGLSFLDTVREEYGSVPFILYPADGSETVAIRAFRNGVTDYVPQEAATDRTTELRDRLRAALEESAVDRERADELRQLRRFKQAIFKTNIAVNIADTEGSIIEINRAAEEICGYSAAELAEGGWELLYPDEEYRAEIRSTVIDVLQSNHGIQEFESTLTTKGGEERTVSWYVQPLTDQQDTVTGAMAVGRDVTERRAREQELEKLTTRLELALEETDTGVWERDLSTNEVFWDEACQQLFGYKPGEFSGEYEEFTQRVHDEDLPAVERAVQQAIESNSLYQADYRIELPDGEQRWIQSRGIVEYDADGEPDRMVGVETDITDRKTAEQTLEETKEYYSRIFQRSSDYVTIVDEEGTIMDVTPGIEQVLGYDPDEMIGTDSFATIHPADRDRITSAMAEVIENSEAEIDIEYRAQASDGSYRWLEARGSNYFDDPLLNGLVANIRDISQRKQTEQALEATKERYQRMFTLSPDYVTIVDAEGTITDITPGAEHVHGHDPDEMIGTNALDLIHPDDRDRIAGVLADVVENPQQDIDIEYRSQTKDGNYRWLEARGNNHLDDPLLEGVVVNVRDISQRKQREQELAQLTQQLKQKNTQLERLAQIVSHDLQTPLSTAEKLTGLLRADLGDPDPQIEQSLADLEATHRRLRGFADHLPRLARESTDIEESTACELRTVAEAAWNVVDTVSLELAVESTCTLSADPERLQRAFENLFQNTVTHAVVATVTGDTGRDCHATATTVRVGSLPDGFYIEDDGPGIRPEQRDELFEYGMGTGSGSGFGLAIVRTIIEAHGWTVDIAESDTGGARFEVDTDT